MTTLSLYHWDFNRLPADSDPRYLTISVAVFQWQPKASGKGLKKVNATRICGYMADIASVYAKAQEICDKLNAANATADLRPPWLQKQYSVPKPKGWIDSRVPDDLPSSVVRSIRAAVMTHVLIPAGFIKGEQGTYVRRAGDQIHLIDFQPSRYGHQYTVNLAFHFAFVTPLFAGKKIKLADYSQLDCGLRARIGDFSKSRLDKWFDYGTDRSLLARTLEKNARSSLETLGRAAQQFRDPRRLLRGSACALNTRTIRPWEVYADEFAPLLALHLGRRKAAIVELERLMTAAEGFWAIRYKRLLAKAQRA